MPSTRKWDIAASNDLLKEKVLTLSCITFGRDSYHYHIAIMDSVFTLKGTRALLRRVSDSFGDDKLRIGSRNDCCQRSSHAFPPPTDRVADNAVQLAMREPLPSASGWCVRG